jgi:hypothetical protein
MGNQAQPENDHGHRNEVKIQQVDDPSNGKAAVLDQGSAGFSMEQALAAAIYE